MLSFNSGFILAEGPFFFPSFQIASFCRLTFSLLLDGFAFVFGPESDGFVLPEHSSLRVFLLLLFP